MLNLFQYLTISRTYETLKRVQGDRAGFFTRPSYETIKGVFLDFLQGHQIYLLDKIPK